MMIAAPVQAATVAALGDTAHVAEQRERYARRRTALRGAFEAAGFRIEHSEASLYLWATRDESCWDTVGDLAKRGILVAPATSTEWRGSGSYGSPSPPPTSGWPPRCAGWPVEPRLTTGRGPGRANSPGPCAAVGGRTGQRPPSGRPPSRP